MTMTQAEFEENLEEMRVTWAEISAIIVAWLTPMMEAMREAWATIEATPGFAEWWQTLQEDNPEEEANGSRT